MAMTKCAECGAEVSTDAAACPQCGFRVGRKRIRMWQSLMLVALGIIAGLIVGVTVGWLSGLVTFGVVQIVGPMVLGRQNIS